MAMISFLEKLMSNGINLPVPYFCQRENKYIWQQRSSDTGEKLPSTKKPLAPITCNITSLCMLLHYFGITDDSPDDMLYKIFDSEEYKNDGKFSQWRTSDYPAEDACPGTLEDRANIAYVARTLYGLEDETEIETFASLTLDRAKKFIQNGMPVWFSYGALTNSGDRGHIAVLRGFNDDGFIVNDPYGNVADPDGFLKETGLKSFSYVYENDKITSGWGTGDNSFIQTSEFKKLIVEKKKFFQALVIRPKKMWFFPSIDSEKQKELSDEDFIKLTLKEEVVISQSPNESILEASFPICGNGIWHTGIHIKGAKGKEIMPIGPGRLVAARNSDLLPIDSKNGMKGQKTNNFILIRHNIPNSTDFFYSYYLHLEKLDVKARLLSNLQFGVIQDDNRDWLNQIIDHVMPKRLVFNRGSDATLYIRNSEGTFLKSDKVGNKKTTAHYYPAKETAFETIWSFSTTMTQKLNLLNDMSTYTDSSNKYYRIMVKAYSNYNYIWEEYYILKDSAGFAQKINEQEFSYYFEQLKSLHEGKTVIFNSEDQYKKEVDISSLSKQDWERIFYDVVRNKLNLDDLQYNKGCRDELWNRIEKFFISNKNNYTLLQVRNELFDLAKYLLNYSYSKISGAFEISDNFFKRMEICYKNVYQCYQDNDGYKSSWEQLFLDIRINYETNTDFYIEMNSKTSLGKFGQVGTDYKIHFDVFSNKDFIKSPSQIEFDVCDYETIYNKKESVKLLQNKLNIGSIKKSLRPNQLMEMYYNNKERLIQSRLKISNDFIVPSVSGMKKIENAINKSIGYNEKNNSYREKMDKVDGLLFLDSQEVDDKDIKSKTLYYYHPTNAIIELNKLVLKDRIFDLFK